MIKTEELKQKIEIQRKALTDKIESQAKQEEIYEESVLLDRLVEKYLEIESPDA